MIQLAKQGHLAMPPQPGIPAPITLAQVLTNWAFWSFVVAALALVISLIGPLRRLLKATRLLMDVHSVIGLDTTFGNPQVNMYIDLRNRGGRNIRVKAMTVTLQRDNSELRILPGQIYFETTSSQQPLLLVPFDIKPEGNWGHPVKFYAMANRQLDQEIRGNISKVREDIRKKKEALEPNVRSSTLVYVDNSLVTPFLELFERQFYWMPGEYIAKVDITTDPKVGSLSKSFRFVIYESEAAELKMEVRSYNIGERISYNSGASVAIHPPISQI